MIWSIPMNRCTEVFIGYCCAGLCALAVSPLPAQEPCFGSARFISTSPKLVSSLFTADLDGDGDEDIIEGSRQFSAHLQAITWYESGAGDRAHVVATTGGLRGFVVSAADLDGDGDIDILGAQHDFDEFMWYENDGLNPPTFAPHFIDAERFRTESIFPTDLDGDGDMDVIFASGFIGPAPSDLYEVGWYENDGNTPPSFARRTISTDVIDPQSVFAADVNGDGRMDVLSASFDDDKIAWYENDGMPVPGFTQHVITTSANGAFIVFAADLDSDGDMDVLSADFLGDQVVFYENNGGTLPSFTKRIIYDDAIGGTPGLIATDLDDDGDVDVIVGSDRSRGQLFCFLNDGSRPPRFTIHATTQRTGAVGALALIDLGGGTGPSVLASVGENLTVYANVLPQGLVASSQRDWVLYP